MTLSAWRTALAVRLLLSVVLAAGAATLAAAQTQQFTPREEEPEDFPDVPGRDDAFFGCTACHNFRLVAAQGMSRRRWDETIDFMIQNHKMPKPSDKDRETILDYLAKAFPERSPAQRGWQNPFLKN
jgi:hypothetical protein